MALVDLVDETYIAAPLGAVAGAFADPASWDGWWPTLTLELDEDRGDEGVRLRVSGDLTGSSEVWLEAYRDGTILHYYLRADPVRGAPADDVRRQRWAVRVARRHAVDFKRRVNALKDRLEGAREPGQWPGDLPGGIRARRNGARTR